MDFASGADVKIDRTGSTGDLTSTGVNAFAYTFADGASFELIANQNVFSGTTTNRGLEIGSYNSIDGFGSGVKIVLQSRPMVQLFQVMGLITPPLMPLVSIIMPVVMLMLFTIWVLALF